MKNGNTTRTNGKQGFGSLPKDLHKALSSKGGKKRGVVKGFAYIKANDPERYQAILTKREATRKANTALLRDATKHTEDNGDDIQA